MFQGLVACTTPLLEVNQNDLGLQWIIKRPNDADNITIGDSICLNGACMTVTRLNQAELFFDIMPETIKKTQFSESLPGDLINFELARKVGDRIGGHDLQGHVDGIASIEKIIAIDNKHHSILMTLPEHLLAMCVPKGFIGVNGISLTITNIKKNQLQVDIIPHTWVATNLHLMREKKHLNIEIDIHSKTLFHFIHQIKKTEENIL